MNAPLISIGMPVYNCADTLAEAIASILKQTFLDWELIIIDDGSTDNTLEVARRFSDPRVRVVAGGKNKHLAARLNEAVVLAKGKYFARMDGDDISYPDRLQKQIDYLNVHPEIDLLGGSILVFGADGKAIGLRRAREGHADICGRAWRPSVLPHVTWMGRRHWFLRNPYREDTRHAQDRELLTRTRRHSRFAGIPDILAGVREAELSLKKQRSARWQFLRTVAREGVRQRDLALLLAGIPLELAKLALDLTAIKSGLRYRLLRHRVPVVPATTAAEWGSLLSETRRTAEQACGSGVPA